MKASLGACWLCLPFVFGGLNQATPRHADAENLVNLVDNFLETWKARHPFMSNIDIEDVHATAEKMKANLLKPPAPTPPSPSHKNGNTTRSIKRSPLSRKGHPLPLLTRNATTSSLGNSTLDRAREIVRLAQAEANIRNMERFNNPRTNEYYDSHGARALRVRSADSASLHVNETVSVAAAIVAEASPKNASNLDYSKYFLSPEVAALAGQAKNSENVPKSALAKRDVGTWWMETMPHDGIVPYGGDLEYKVFRNVKDYGAMGDGNADDTDAIMKAMKDGGRCGANCGSSTIKPAIVYFPAGTYKVSKSIEMYYNTQLIGSAVKLPIIKAAESFVGLGVVSSDVYTGGNGGADEWFINQNNFLRQVRNFVIDTSESSLDNVAGLHWQVAQATSVYNVHFYGSKDANKHHIGIFAENGSGGHMSSLVFLNTAVGIRCGNQQFTTTHLAFSGVTVAVDLLWDWGWTWKNLVIVGATYAFTMNGTYRGGSMLLMDSTLWRVTGGISISTPKGATDPEEFSITLNNVKLIDVAVMVIHEPSNTNLIGGSYTIDSWILGRVYNDDNINGSYQKGWSSASATRTPNLIDATGDYYTRLKPQYETKDANFFISAHFATKGDGVHDDTFGLALALAVARDSGRGLYIPMGSYIITETLYVPVGSVIVGECWAQLVAKGARFQDISKPTPMISVGNSGDKGSVEIQDLLFTVQGPTAGVVLVEWNVAQSQQGSAAMWDSHFRIGGAFGSELQVANCPKLSGTVNKNCIAGSLMLHMTEKSSGYLENIWAWVADHDLDSGPDQTQIDIYVARGILIESREGPVWLYGTSSEHAILYQYNIFGAKNIVMAMIQTESPYFLPDPQAPEPFTTQLGEFGGDPRFEDCQSTNSHCAAAWGLQVFGATNVHVFGAGLYNWFQRYVQPCVDSQDCQQRVVNIQESGTVWLYNVYTIGTVEMITAHDHIVLSKDNTNTNEHPFTSVVNAWLLASTGEGSGGYQSGTDDDDDDDGPLPACLASFDTIEQLQVAYDSDRIPITGSPHPVSGGNVPQSCVSHYLAKIYWQQLSSAISNFHLVFKDNYDAKFKIFRQIIKEQTLHELQDIMIHHPDGSFSCFEPQPKTCCDICPTYPGSKPPDPCIDLGCTYQSDPKLCKEAYDKPVPCPSTISLNAQSTKWVLSDEKKFNETLRNRGIPRDWIELKDFDYYYGYGCIWNVDEDKAAEEVLKCIHDGGITWYGYPQLKDNFVLSDPSVAVRNSIDSLTALRDKAANQIDLAELRLTEWTDIADALMTPALISSAAVSEMQNIDDTANKKIEADRKAEISAFVTMLFLLIPVAGEAAEEIGAATLRIIIDMAGELANAAYSIYDAVSDGDSPLQVVMALAFGGTSFTPFKQAARRVRNMNAETKGKFPPKLKDKVESAKRMQCGCDRE